MQPWSMRESFSGNLIWPARLEQAVRQHQKPAHFPEHWHHLLMTPEACARGSSPSDKVRCGVRSALFFCHQTRRGGWTSLWSNSEARRSHDDRGVVGAPFDCPSWQPSSSEKGAVAASHQASLLHWLGEGSAISRRSKKLVRRVREEGRALRSRRLGTACCPRMARERCVQATARALHRATRAGGSARSDHAA